MADLCVCSIGAQNVNFDDLNNHMLGLFINTRLQDRYSTSFFRQSYSLFQIQYYTNLAKYNFGTQKSKIGILLSIQSVYIVTVG